MKQAHLAPALADCLARVEAGASPDSVLADYPALAPELAPLLAAAGAVGQLPPALPRPAYRAHLATELAQLEAHLAAERVATPASAGLGRVALVVGALALLGLLAALGPRVLDRRPLAAQGPAAIAAIGVADRAAAQAAPTAVTRRQAPPAGAGGRGSAALETVAGAGAAGDGSASGGDETARAIVAAPRRSPAPASAARSGGPAGGGPVTVLPAPPAPPSPTAAAPVDPPPTDEPDEPATPQPEPTATIATAPRAGSGHVAGRVTLGDRPLAGVTVGIFAVPEGGDCPPAPGDAPLATTRTDADGHFSLELPGGDLLYRLAAWDEAHCLPRRWHTGPTDLAAADPCAESVQRFMVPPEASANSLNILFAEADARGCGG